MRTPKLAHNIHAGQGHNGCQVSIDGFDGIYTDSVDGNGLLMYTNAALKLALRVELRGEYFVFTGGLQGGLQGEHSLAADEQITDAKRLRAHWIGYVDNNIKRASMLVTTPAAAESTPAAPAGAYRQMSTIPPHIRYQAKQDTPVAEIPTCLKWSSLTMDVPLIGMIVHVRINSIRAARVVGYFTEHGFLGLLVKPLAPPAWFVKQNGRHSTAHVFGTEIDPLSDDETKRATVRVVRHRDPSDIGVGTLRRGDRFTVRVYAANGSLLLDGRETRKDPELAVKLAEKFCTKNKLNLFTVEFPS